jgi:hypothetical protein
MMMLDNYLFSFQNKSLLVNLEAAEHGPGGFWTRHGLVNPKGFLDLSGISKELLRIMNL